MMRGSSFVRQLEVAVSRGTSFFMLLESSGGSFLVLLESSGSSFLVQLEVAVSSSVLLESSSILRQFLPNLLV